MKVIVAGCRDFYDYELVEKTLSPIEEIDEIVCGGAKGADSLGKRYALNNNIPIKYFYADWDTYGRAAGPVRNKQMAEYADFLVAFWDGKSRGTKNMIQNMEQSNKDFIIIRIKRK